MPAKQPKLEEAASEQRAAIAHARSVSHRLDLRLPPNDPVLQRYKTSGMALDDLAAITMNASPGHNYANYRDELVEIDKSLGGRPKRFWTKRVQASGLGWHVGDAQT